MTLLHMIVKKVERESKKITLFIEWPLYYNRVALKPKTLKIIFKFLVHYSQFHWFGKNNLPLDIIFFRSFSPLILILYTHPYIFNGDFIHLCLYYYVRFICLFVIRRKCLLEIYMCVISRSVLADQDIAVYTQVFNFVSRRYLKLESGLNRCSHVS